MDDLTPLALANLLRMRMRLLLTIGGVTVGTRAVILLIAFSLGLQNAAENGLGSDWALTEIYITAKADTGEDNRLNSNNVKQLQKVPGTKAVIPELSLQSNVIMSGQYTANRQVIGIDPDLLSYV